MKYLEVQEERRKGKTLAKQDWNWGQKLEDFPVGMWDDFDGKIDMAEYEKGEYGAQIFLLVMPAKYEWEAREEEPPEEGEDTGMPRGWYGLGGKEDTYRISNDGMEITGPSPVRNTRGVKLMQSVISASGVKLKSTSLVDFQDLEVHWKLTIEKTKNPTTGDMVERPVLYATGKPLGYATMSEESGSRGGSTRRGRRGRTEESEELPDGLSETPERQSRRRGATRASTEEAAETSEAKDEASKPSSNGSDEGATRELAFAEIVKLVAETGEAGLKRTLLPTVAMQLDGDIPEEVFTMISKRGTVNAAIEAEKIVNDEGVLRLPVEA